MSSKTPAPVTLHAVTKRYGDLVVLDGLGLVLEPGRVTALTGPNGVGKTTVGRLLLGLETPDAGSVTGAQDLRRSAVFQEDRLCAHLDAIANVRLVLDRERRSGSTARATAEDELARVGLEGEDASKPVRDLSGGQRRRVAIARAMAAPSDLVVLDEPFTGLDAETKPAVMAYVRERIAGRTAVLITHDPAEVEFFKARVVRLRRGPGLVV
ncbi:ATP-binding cassette domain-containing protein [Demequina lutea]|uniref:NitT/TauT family transport system ATP-binding protein n=1 Tax=Demequina lutea TaxID=431489 RepID=A0A7Z0CLA6_9MICO|nr:ATP-binding cassette domain-containing protein [Demequina lutea]NYI42718.1 NitT/TauT family transport system ATP-binding protein [Demequina lutea]